STPIFVGSFGYDSEHGYDLEWDNMIEMEEWLHRQQQSRGFELKLKDTQINIPTPQNPVCHWSKTRYYVCPRQGTSGSSHYTKKNPDRTPKVPGKRVTGGCPCRLTIKSYPGTHKVLGRFIDKHSHQIGQDNLIYMNISPHIREKV
ncbi:hypothetical protein C8J56DRAFT_749722, partial [Mycena floridula]